MKVVVSYCRAGIRPRSSADGVSKAIVNRDTGPALRRTNGSFGDLRILNAIDGQSRSNALGSVVPSKQTVSCDIIRLDTLGTVSGATTSLLPIIDRQVDKAAVLSLEFA